MKILFFGDIVGKIGRTAIRQVIADLKKEVEPAIKKVLAESLLRSAALNEKIANMWAKVEVFIKQGKSFAKRNQR